MSDILYSLFSTREVAAIIYFLLAVIFIISGSSRRKGFTEVLRYACKLKLVVPFILLVGYGTVLTWILSNITIWDNVYIKDITLWVIFVGIPFCFNAASTGNDNQHFMSLFLDNLKLCVILEFFIGTFTFALWIELILLPFVIMLILLHTLSATKKEWKKVTMLLDYIMALIGIIILICTVKAALGMYKTLDPIEVLVSFSIPILFSLFFIPCAYLLAVYARYDSLFARMKFMQPDNNKLRIHRNFKIIMLCGLSYKNIGLFNKEYVRKMYINMDESTFDEIVIEFKKKYK